MKALGAYVLVLSWFDLGCILLTQAAVEAFVVCPCKVDRPFWKSVLDHITFPITLNG